MKPANLRPYLSPMLPMKVPKIMLDPNPAMKSRPMSPRSYP